MFQQLVKKVVHRVNTNYMYVYLCPNYVNVRPSVKTLTLHTNNHIDVHSRSNLHRFAKYLIANERVKIAIILEILFTKCRHFFGYLGTF